MAVQQQNDQFSQIHIDVVRNATDDFNLFHDSQRWSEIVENPFQGAIVPGFQIESLIEHKIHQHRLAYDEVNWIKQNNLNFSNYQFSFANAIKPEKTIFIDIKTTQQNADASSLSNRVSVKCDGKLALIGFKKETQKPLFLNEGLINSAELQNVDLRQYPDRRFLKEEQGSFFLKRKFMTASNAKNFLCGSLIDQRIYFDELKDRYHYPEIFPCAYISCALLEKSLQENLDFKKNPLVYTSHKISIDRFLVSQIKSNDVLHILIKKRVVKSGNSPLQTYECYGLVGNNQILFRAIVDLITLQSILKNKKDV